LLKVLLAYATHYGLYIHQMDVCSAFLNGHLKEEVYMILPKSLDIFLKDVDFKSQSNLVCKLLKSLYGLK
jgi:hypothetical protein